MEYKYPCSIVFLQISLVFNECIPFVITGIHSFRDAQCNFRLTTEVTGFAGHRALRTCNSYWNPQVRSHFPTQNAVQERTTIMTQSHCTGTEPELGPGTIGKYSMPSKCSYWSETGTGTRVYCFLWWQSHWLYWSQSRFRVACMYHYTGIFLLNNVPHYTKHKLKKERQQNVLFNILPLFGLVILGITMLRFFYIIQESIQESDIDELLMGMASQVTEREDNIITPDLRGMVTCTTYQNTDYIYYTECKITIT